MKECITNIFNVWECEALGVPEQEYPTSFHFYEKDKFISGKRNGKKCTIVGFAKGINEKTPDQYLVVFDGENSIAGVAQSTIVMP